MAVFSFLLTPGQALTYVANQSIAWKTMISAVFALVMLGLFATAIMLPILVVSIHANLEDPWVRLDAPSSSDAVGDLASTFHGNEESSPAGEAMPGVPDGVRHDVELGLVYRSPPPEDLRDDLTKIKGVGPVMEGKLHSLGVFTYQQIAQWSELNAARFSERLAFKDRVRRDRWQEQCAAMYSEKHGKT